MKIKCYVVGMICFFVSQLPLASAANPEIELKGAVRIHSCGYYSSMVGDFAFAYHNDDLPWGTKVILHYGYQVQTYQMNGQGQGTNVLLTWQDPKQIEMSAVSDFGWGAYLQESIHYRSKPSAAPHGINFAFEVILPDGATFWEKGINTPNGHYTGIWDHSSVKCVSPNTPPAVLEDLPISVNSSSAN